MKARTKDILRGIKKSRMRFFYMLAIVALGVSFFVGLKGVAPSMRVTAQNYFREFKLADVHLMSEYGFTGEDIDRLAAVDGVAQAQGAYSMDVITDINGTNYTSRLMSYSGPDQINLPSLQEGRLPESKDECVIQKSEGVYLYANIGDTITVTDESQSADTLKNLTTRTFTVVGLVDDPLYITHDLGSTTVGKGSLDNYVIVTPEAFSYERYTDAWILSDATADGISPFSETYDTDIDELVAGLEIAEQKNIDIQYQDIVDTANDEIQDGQDELDENRATYEQEIADAQQQLDEAKTELDEAADTIASSEATLLESEQTLRDSESQLADGKSQLESGKAELAENQTTLTETEKTLAEGKTQLEAAKKELATQKAQWEAGVATLTEEKEKAESGLAQIEDGFSQIAAQREELNATLAQIDQGLMLYPDNAELLEQKAQVEAGLQTLTEKESELTVQKQTVEAGLEEIAAKQAELDAAGEQIQTGEATLAEKEAELNAGQAQVDSGKKQLSSAQETLTASEAQLESAQAEIDSGWAQVNEGWDELNSGKEEYASGLAEYEDGVAELNEQMASAEQEFADAQKKIDDAKQELADLDKGTYYTYTRDDFTGYSDFNENAERIDKIANVFPVFFLMVAMLVAFSTMTRMVEEERTELGTLCALGYSKGQILQKYAIYAGSASLIGAVIGAVFGAFFFPWFIYNAYMVMYHMPDVTWAFDWPVIILAFVVALACTVGAAVLVGLFELRSTPAELMRPKAPKPGKRIFLERIPILWNRFSFIAKVSARNVLRYKSRFFMTVIGIAGCTALLLTGFGLHDAIFTILPNQFDELQVYDSMVVLESAKPASDYQSLMDKLGSDDRISEAMLLSQEQGTASSDKSSKTLTVYVMSPENADQFQDFIRLRDRTDESRKVTLSDDGAVIPERTADLLGVSPGDDITVKIDGVEYTVPVTDTTENYLENYVYLSPKAYEKVMGKAATYNAALLNLTAAGEADTDQLQSDLIEDSNVLTVTSMSGMADTVNDQLSSLNMIVIVIVIFSGILAFIVLFNLTNINISEREREIATLKVLGFYPKETTHYVFRENVVLAVVGMILGLFMGVALLNFILDTVETDIMMFGRVIFWQSYVYACVMTIAFTLIVNWAMSPTINRIDMVEALKSIE